MKNLVAGLLAILLIVNVQGVEVEVEDHVLVLDDSNFDEEIAKHKFLLIEFYAPWCGHCKTLAPEYAKAAKELSQENPPIHLAKVDATKADKLSKRFEVKGFPTLKFYANGEYVEYQGGRTSDDIVNWLKKKTGPVTVNLASLAEVETFHKQGGVALVYFGEKNTSEFAIFEKIASSTEGVLFGTTNSPDALSKFNSRIVLFKNFDEGRNDFTETEITEESLTNFIDSNSFPLVSKFDERAAEFIFGKNKVAIFLFREEKDAVRYDELFRSLAPAHKGKLVFVSTGIIGDLEEKIAEYYSLTPANLPQIRITDVKGEEDVRNYVLQGEITVGSLNTFINDFYGGKLQVYLKSEEIPTNQTEAVYSIVGKTFVSHVLENPKNVLIEFYAPWCGHCKKLTPIYEKVASDYRDHPKILIAKMDATANEVESLTIGGYPTLKWYGADKSAPIDYEGERDFDSIKDFIEEKINPDYVKPKRAKKAKIEEETDDEDNEGHDHEHDEEHDHDHDHDHEHEHGHDDHDHGHDHSHDQSQADATTGKTEL